MTMEVDSKAEWEAPPPPEKIEVDQHEMSELATLGNIFLEPGRTFEDLKKKPRFLIAAIIIALLISAFAFGVAYKVGDDGMRRYIAEQMDKNPQVAAMSAEQKASAIGLQMTITSVIRYVLPLIILITLAIGGLFYWLGAKAFGGTGTFLHGLSVWVYSMFPPTVVAMVANFIILTFKSADDIDITSSQRGIVPSNLGFLFGPETSPVLVTLISVLDLFAIWGWVLAAIGLRITNRLSSGSSWAIVLIFALIGVTFRVIGSFFSGSPN